MIIYVYTLVQGQYALTRVDDTIYRRQGGGGIAKPAPPPAPIGFDFTQAVPAAVWRIPHSLGYRPVVQVTVDPNVIVNNVDMIHVDLNNVEVTFFIPVSGTARCV